MTTSTAMIMKGLSGSVKDRTLRSKCDSVGLISKTALHVYLPESSKVKFSKVSLVIFLSKWIL